MKCIFFVMLAFCMFSAIAFAGVGITEVRNIFPEAIKIAEEEGLNGSWQVFGEANKVIGYVYASEKFASDVKGYAGVIPLLIGISADDTVKGICVLENKETPIFFKRVEKSQLLNKWNGMKCSDAENLQIDAVSRATISSTAIIKSVRKTLAGLKEK